MSGETNFKMNEKGWTPKPELYDFGRPFPAERVISLFAQSKVISSDSRLKVYEPGCGTGRIILPLAIHYPNWKLTGGEISRTVLKVCLERSAQADLSNVTLIKEDLSDPKAPGKFDIIIFSSVLHAISNWKIALNQIRSLLSDDGLIVLVGDYGDLYDEVLGRESSADTDPGLVNFWQTYRDVRKLVGAVNPEASQVGARWDLENSEIASQLFSLDYEEIDCTCTNWKHNFTYAELLQIVEEKCYSSMFTVPDETYREIIKTLKSSLKDFDMNKKTVSRHKALARFFRFK